MDLKLRPGDLEDAEACGRIAHEAFAAIAARHGFPADIPSPEAGVGLVSRMLESPDFYAVVAERAAESSAATSWTNGQPSTASDRSRSTPLSRTAAWAAL